jgi:hypothetical protein
MNTVMTEGYYEKWNRLYRKERRAFRKARIINSVTEWSIWEKCSEALTSHENSWGLPY